jgi:hypothetical protein
MNKRYIRIRIHLINETKSNRTELKKKAKKDDDRMLYPEPARKEHEIVHIAVFYSEIPSRRASGLDIRG